jgi:hypothetical protein
MPASSESIVTAQGLELVWVSPGLHYVRKYVGEEQVPQSIKSLRRKVYDAMRHLGSPVLVKHRYNADDVERGLARRSDNYSKAYGQGRHDDPISHGVGFVSVEEADDEWVMPDGTLKYSETQPSGAIKAPKYRGYGPGYLLWMIQPDAAVDLFKVNEAGVFIKVQSATAQAPWFPEINDNDLIINVEVDPNGSILKTYERFQAKQTNPVSIRGMDRSGRKEYTEDGGNRFVVNQNFEMALMPETDIVYKVEVDR